MLVVPMKFRVSVSYRFMHFKVVRYQQVSFMYINMHVPILNDTQCNKCIVNHEFRSAKRPLELLISSCHPHSHCTTE